MVNVPWSACRGQCVMVSVSARGQCVVSWQLIVLVAEHESRHKRRHDRRVQHQKQRDPTLTLRLTCE